MNEISPPGWPTCGASVRQSGSAFLPVAHSTEKAFGRWFVMREAQPSFQITPVVNVHVVVVPSATPLVSVTAPDIVAV
jgi:hypothetical protein